MSRKSTRVKFENQNGQTLVGILDLPLNDVKFSALFAHCFTCGKDLKALVRLSRLMTQAGIAVLRFDFTGLNDSAGDFSETNLSTNIADVQSAVTFLSRTILPPALLVGHSLGGTALTIAANDIPSARALITIASPSSTKRLAEFLSAENPEIDTPHGGRITIGGKEFLLKQQLLENLRSHDVETALANLKLPILMFHSPQDQTLPYHWGLKMFNAAGGNKAFVTLDGSDHLLAERPEDVEFVAKIAINWAERYIKQQDFTKPQ
ncbi:MAG TPA: alpha/beta hydrolase [Pirellulaceae bacterium]|nr:alpha/beta hydrolase [Pirellulaceae bacterium]HMO93181.1 alpha/beta hydrolase [Pirellulaceae bacterium]HMP69990.1 alpha/beta hydrolase [Pirellulaceae bacterium]